MTNLPITSNAPPPANTANPAQSNNSAANAQMADTQAAGSFASLLARQIDEADSPEVDAAQIAITLGATDPNLMATQDQTTTATDATVDPANALTAMLLQIPQEMRAPISNGAADNTAAQQNSMVGIDTPARKMASLFYARPGMANIASGKADALAVASGKADILAVASGKADILAVASGKADALAVAIDKTDTLAVATDKTDTLTAATDKLIIADALNLKRAELPSGLTSPVQNTTQAINSSVISPMMPNLLAGNKIIDTPQTIATPLGSSAWADDFSQRISWMGTQQNQVAELHLNPPDLGPLNVVLRISDNQATALFTSPHSAVRDAVENAMPKLREILADNGIMLGNATVSDQPPRDRNADGSMNQGSGAAIQREDSAEASKLTALSAAQIVPTRRHDGMVDTFA